MSKNIRDALENFATKCGAGECSASDWENLSTLTEALSVIELSAQLTVWDAFALVAILIFVLILLLGSFWLFPRMDENKIRFAVILLFGIGAVALNSVLNFFF